MAARPEGHPSGGACGGAGRDRTDDLMLAKHALSQLSYSPKRWDLNARENEATPQQGRPAARANARESLGNGRRRRRLRLT